VRGSYIRFLISVLCLSFLQRSSYVRFGSWSASRVRNGTWYLARHAVPSVFRFPFQRPLPRLPQTDRYRRQGHRPRNYKKNNAPSGEVVRRRANKNTSFFSECSLNLTWGRPQGHGGSLHLEPPDLNLCGWAKRPKGKKGKRSTDNMREKLFFVPSINSNPENPTQMTRYLCRTSS
jgi:hypothetical protein